MALLKLLLLTIFQFGVLNCLSPSQLNDSVQQPISSPEKEILGLLFEGGNDNEALISALEAILESTEPSSFSPRNALFLAIELGRVEAAKKLIDNFESEKPLAVAGKDGNAAIHLAAKFNRAEIVGALLGRDPKFASLLNKANQTPLHVALDYGSLKAAAAILESQHISRDGLRSIILQRDVNDRTIVHLLSLHCNSNAFSAEFVELFGKELKPHFATTQDMMDILGETPLEIAVKRNCIDFVKMYLHEAGPGGCLRRNRQGYTPLHLAKRLGLNLLVREMAKNGACSLDQVDVCGISVRQIGGAIKEGVDRCDELPRIENGAIVTSSIIKDRSLFCLGSAVEFVCKTNFILRGSNVLECNSQGRWTVNGYCEAYKCYEIPPISDQATALLAATQASDLNTIRRILSSTPQRLLISESTWKNGQNNSNKKGDSPLHVAAKRDRIESLKTLWSCMSDLAEMQNADKEAAIHIAILNNSTRVVDFLLSERAASLLELKDGRYGRTPLHIASSLGYLNFVNSLVNKFKANFYAKTSDTESLPIHLAAMFSQIPAVVDFFLKNDPKLIDQTDNQGNRPLHKAAIGGNIAVVEYLISKMGVASVELSQGSHGRTPLHLACEKGRLELVKLLVTKYKANVYAKSDKVRDSEKMPIHLAASQGRFEVVKFLVEAYPDLVGAKDSNGETPLKFAEKSGTSNEAPKVAAWLKLKTNE